MAAAVCFFVIVKYYDVLLVL